MTVKRRPPRRRRKRRAPISSDDLSPEEEGRRAMDAALSFLAYRPRTATEVRRKLGVGGFDEATAERTLVRLAELDLVNDRSFVETYVRDRIANRPMGVRRLRDELYRKGIAGEVAVPIIERVFADEGVDERSLAQRAAGKKMRTLTAGPDAADTVRRRLSGHLARRGFGMEVVRNVVNELLNESEDEEDDEGRVS